MSDLNEDDKENFSAIQPMKKGKDTVPVSADDVLKGTKACLLIAFGIITYRTNVSSDISRSVYCYLNPRRLHSTSRTLGGNWKRCVFRDTYFSYIANWTL